MQGGEDRLPVERQMSPKGRAEADCGLWLVVGGHLLTGGEAVGCKKQGGRKPKCDCNPGWSFSDFSFQALWLGVCGVCWELCVAFLTPAQDCNVRAVHRQECPSRDCPPYSQCWNLPRQQAGEWGWGLLACWQPAVLLLFSCCSPCPRHLPDIAPPPPRTHTGGRGRGVLSV